MSNHASIEAVGMETAVPSGDDAAGEFGEGSALAGNELSDFSHL
jgi:hypothetical protein